MNSGWDQSQFDRTLKEYARHTTRTVEQVINTKLYYIARRATWYTPRADKTAIAREIGAIVSVPRAAKRGKGKVVMKRMVYRGSGSARGNKTLAMVIIMARRKRKGQRGLGPDEMSRAVRAMIAGRMRSRAFLASGWLTAIRILAPLADKGGAPQMGSDAKVYGRSKGRASPAWGMGATVGIMRGSIENMAHKKTDPESQALMKHASRALERAFLEETQSMKDYIERKMVEDILAFNEQQH